jgi:hypothetical protein
MVLYGKSTIFKHGKATTLYLAIPAHMAVDSQFTFKAGDKVSVTFLPKNHSNKVPVLVIHKLRRAEEV